MQALDREQIGNQNINTELDEANINVELEQGRSQVSGKLQQSLLK